MSPAGGGRCCAAWRWARPACQIRHALFRVWAALAGLFDARREGLVLSRRGLVILVLGFLILSPNLFWNASHGYPTLAHTEANANWGRAKYNAGNAVRLHCGQFGVFGPLMMADGWGALASPARHARRTTAHSRRLQRAGPYSDFIQSFISDANANWAAPAYVAAVPWRWLRSSDGGRAGCSGRRWRSARGDAGLWAAE